MTTLGFLEVVLHLCFKHQGSVISWVRSKKHNARIGGHNDSRHLDGRACDGRNDTEALRNQLFEEACRCGLRGYKRGKLFWHLQADPPRRQ